MPLCQPDRGERMGKINSPYALAFLILLILFSVVSCFKPQTQKIQQTGVYHLVKKNETVPMIAQAYGLSPHDLARANHLKDNKPVKAGSVIFVPYATHVIDDINVKTVDTKSNISALKYSSDNVKQSVKNKEIKETNEAKQINEEKEIKEVKKEVEEVNEIKTVTEAPIVAPVKEVVPAAQNPKIRHSIIAIREEPLPAKNLPKEKFPDKKIESKSTAQKPVENEKIKIDKNRFIWPVRGSVKADFGIQPNKTFNNWIKIVSKPGAKVKAAANGVVIFSSYLKNYGETIIIRHKDNYATVYTHLKKRYVRIDQSVKKGETVAVLGEKDDAGDSYMNFEIRLKGKARNPMYFLP